MQLVPTQWLHGNKCAFPPYLSQKRIEKAIQDLEEAGNDWKNYTVLRLFGFAPTYANGLQKLELATQFSKISTENEAAPQNRKRKRRATSQIDSDEDEDGDEDIIPKEILLPMPVIKLEQPESPHPITRQNSDADSPFVTTRTQRRTVLAKSCEECKSPDALMEFLKEFKESTFKKLNQIAQRLDLLEKRLPEKEKKDEPKLDLVEEKFPITDISALYGIEMKLKDKVFCSQLVNTLKGIGGNDLYSITTSILKRLLTNEVAEFFSWAGQKKKLPFKDLSIFRIVLETVRCHHPSATEVQVSDLISKWLVQAKLRRQRATEKKGDLSD